MNKVGMMSAKEKKKGALVPRLRFPEFREVGEWDCAHMDDIYAFKKNYSFSRDMLNYNSGDVKNIHYGDIHKKFSSHFYAENENIPFVNRNINLESISEDCLCTAGDIIFADASEDMKDIGKCIEIISNNKERILSGLHTIFARQWSSTLVIGFGGHLFQSPRVRVQIQKEAHGTKILGISSGRLAKISISFPFAKGEQQKIADCLSSLDERIAAETNKLAALKAHKNGLLKQLFPAEGETLPQLRFPEFRDAGEWEVTTIGKICKCYSGGTPNTTHREFYGGDIPFIRSAEIGKNSTELFLSELGVRHSSAKLVKKGAVLVALYGANSGEVAISPIEGVINQAILCLESDQNNVFLYNHILNIQQFIIVKYIQGGQGNLSAEIIKSIQLYLPDMPEQQRIADCLSSLDELITAQTQKIDLLKTHKKGLMQQLFPVIDEAKA